MSLGIENQNLKNQDNIITKQAEQMDIHTKNGNVYYGNRLLNEFDFTDELIDAIRQKSDKPHFSNDRIKAIMRNIVASNPKVRIWGGRNAFINYMVKAVNNEKEFTKEEKSQSLAEMKRREAEKLLWQFENKIITYF
jgi:HD-like signal output (HDOD) protein